MSDPVKISSDALREAVRLRDGSEILRIAESLHYADIADVFEELNNGDDRAYLAQTLGPDQLSDIVPDLPETITAEVIDSLKVSQQRELLQSASDDDRVDIIQDLPESEQERMLSLLGGKDLELTRQLLNFGEETAGGRMTTQIGLLTADLTVKQAIEHLRVAQEETETLARIFVTDKDGCLLGKLRLRDLTFSSRETPVRDLMSPVEHSILATADQEEAMNMIRKYDLVVLPVLDEFERLLGVITYDDAMEILEEESTEDIEKMSGIAGEQREEPYLQTTTASHFKRRFPWLFGLAFLAIASGYVMLRYEDTLKTIFLLSLFLPMVVASGGNSGGQAATMVIRAMSLGELGNGNVTMIALKELRLGALLGGAIAMTIFLLCVFVLPLFHPALPHGITCLDFGVAVGLALAIQITVSTFIGAILPLGARSIQLDPAVVASPAITTIVDVSGMVIYFVIARAYLGI